MATKESYIGDVGIGYIYEIELSLPDECAGAKIMEL